MYKQKVKKKKKINPIFLCQFFTNKHMHISVIHILFNMLQQILANFCIFQFQLSLP